MKKNVVCYYRYSSQLQNDGFSIEAQRRACSEFAIKNDYKKNELDDFLSKLSLDKNLLAKKPHELSGGQVQRCSIL